MKLKRENRGFSLVELIVVIAIFSVVSVVVGGFLFAASRSYSINANELNLQDEAQLVANQMQEMILDTAYGISYKYVVTDDTGAELINFMENDATTLPAGDLAQKDLYIYGKDQYYHITWDVEEKKLYLMEYVKLPGATDYTPAEGMETLEPKGVMLGQYIKEFKVDLTKVAENRMVSFSILFEKNGSNRDYLVARNVSLRNDVMTNKETAAVYEAAGIELQPKPDKIEVTPNSPVTLWPGETQQYRVTTICTKGGVPSQSATWNIASLDGVTLHPDTKVNASNLLSISPEEESSEVKLDVYANGYDYSSKTDVEIRPSGSDLTVYVRQIKNLVITDNNFEDEGFPITKGGTYKIKVKMDGENLPANVSDAGGIIAQFTEGGSYAEISSMEIDGLTAEFTIQIKDTAPDDGEIGLSFRAAKPEFSDVFVNTDFYSFTGASNSGLQLSQVDVLAGVWRRVDTSKVVVEFTDEDFAETICKDDGTLREGYSIRYKYVIRDSSNEVTRTITSTVGATSATVTDPKYITSIKHNTAFEAEAILSDQVSLESGSVVVSAELIHNTGGTPVVISSSPNVTYSIPEATVAFKRAMNEKGSTTMTSYITETGNTTPIYVTITSGFNPEYSNYKISLDQAACTNTSFGSVSSGLSDVSKNLITIAGNKSANYKASPANEITFTYGGLPSKVTIKLVKSNVSGRNYYVPTASSEWTHTGQEKKTVKENKKDKTYLYDYYSYYIDDMHRMDIVYKDNKYDSSKFVYYENMAEKSIAYTLNSSTDSWTVK